MNEESDIPLLEDLISPGQLDEKDSSMNLNGDENQDIEIEQDHESPAPESQAGAPFQQTGDDLAEDANMRELIIDEEIRMILDKHMDKAYEEIVRLLNHRIS